MIKNIHPGEALIAGAAFLVPLLMLAFGLMPEFDLYFALVFGWIPGVPLGRIVIGTAVVSGVLIGAGLAWRDAVAKRPA
jgi:hypothetical protein